MFKNFHSYSTTTQLLDAALVTLRVLDSSDFADSLTSFPRPYSDYANLDLNVSPLFDLPSILVPPEIIELDGLSTDAGEDAQVKKEEWPEYFQRLFDTSVRMPGLCRISTFLHISTADNTGPHYRLWLCGSFRVARHYRHIRSEPEGMRPSFDGVSQMDFTRNVQAQARCSC